MEWEVDRIFQLSLESTTFESDGMDGVEEENSDIARSPLDSRPLFPAEEVPYFDGDVFDIGGVVKTGVDMAVVYSNPTYPNNG